VRPADELRPKSIVAAGISPAHTPEHVSAGIRNAIENLSPSLSSLVARGDKVLVKVNMGCSGARSPELRYTSHPAYVEAIIRCLQDCGADVTFGDDVSRAPRHIDRLWKETGMTEVARRTGAKLADFIAAGGREVRGFLLYPRTHFITNLAFEADVIVNAANCRSLADVVMSGAIKNMFGLLLGRRKRQLHALFPDIRDFSRVLVDVFRVVTPAISFLDLTSVIEGQSIAPRVREVGLLLASTDPVALDTVAAHAIGYDELTVWTSIFGQQAGLGTKDMNQIEIRGGWDTFETKRLLHPAPPRMGRGNLYDRATRLLNNSIFRPRPAISSDKCTECGDCVSRCPANAIHATTDSYAIDLAKCADCECCAKVCEAGAVELRFVGVGKVIRTFETILRPQSNRNLPSFD
jgi:uncharacterized protein (DUF362 family)/ferredoxin